jgi:hypothetical protein
MELKPDAHSRNRPPRKFSSDMRSPKFGTIVQIWTMVAHPHMLRQACGFKLANDGKDTRSLQAYLGHRNIQHTVKYTALSSGTSFAHDSAVSALSVLATSDPTAPGFRLSRTMRALSSFDHRRSFSLVSPIRSTLPAPGCF